MNHCSLDSALYKAQEIEFQNWHARLLNKNISSQQKYPQGWIKKFMNHYNILSGIILFQSFRIGMNEWCIDAKDQKQQGYINGFCFVD